MHRQRFKLGTLIIFFVCLVVLISLSITDILISNDVSQDIRKSQEEKAQIIARTIAKSDIVISEMDSGQKSNRIQDFTRDIQSATNVLFIVVMDMEGIRKSHPNTAMIGKPFVGGDEKQALKGNEYVSISEGTLGKSVRAFTPIFNEEGRQLGAVAVGISLETLKTTVNKNHREIFVVTTFGLIIGIIGAILLSRYIKKVLLGLEPFAIAKILEERSRMLQSVHEGIIAVDHNSTITLVNKSALQIFKKAGLSQNPVGMKIHDYLPSNGLDHVLKSGQPELDEENMINGVVSILVNRVPLVVDGQVVGAISTFRDKTEMNQLAEQLTGVKTYAETLRAQSHEFMNRLHVILGMVQMKAYDELSEFILTLVDFRNQESGNIAQHIKDPALAGFIMGKLSYAREQNVDLSIEIDSVIPELSDTKVTHGLITIIGNLVDNGVEAMADCDEKTLELSLSFHGGFLTVEVFDSGPGIPAEAQGKIFEKGYSTKGENRGYGLYLVAKNVKELGGTLTIDSKLLLGTNFIVQIPIVL
ncbi:DcuS/MalK family sensor histidine kinase [Bacillus sp. EB01]|uniref:DcuS/MalK family sensor histidine kinase n=1 Tax=Bacillus sp. EB01 TaxID=1347086 RepID=UPI0005C78C86|nr:DcuS/MalK family sensor histidine kinase [Bacillus sp. EB01]